MAGVISGGVVRHNFLLGGVNSVFLPLYRNAPEKERHNLVFYSTFTLGEMWAGGAGEVVT
jgi:hypothetical protein